MIRVDNEETLLAEGFSTALIGNCGRTFKSVYSMSMMIDVLITDRDMDYEEARNYLDKNVVGVYVGEYTPIYLNDIDVV